MKEFIKKMISSSNESSSKRFNGTYGFAIFCLMIIFLVTYDKIDNGEIEAPTSELLKLLGYLSALLLGVTAIEKIWTK